MAGEIEPLKEMAHFRWGADYRLYQPPFPKQLPPPTMADIFFSYSREDLKRILSIVRPLKKQGFTIFWDRTIPAGKSWREVISGELEAARCVMVA